ncbi:radical SAM protein [Plantibacter sp. CFBP 8798]|uniref:radical SAM protein n=1 Tax=Plantibacter sp. CFBP 8798 TaxID=2775268 RepID=UPI00177F928F|nr:radical SAM protein [Plantibacter sp. CFBP 8798]MBD8467071.1 radical SAM protein [Plantibacter sp. CFBP 8798]
MVRVGSDEFVDPVLLQEFEIVQKRERLLPVLVPNSMKGLLAEEASVLGRGVGPLARSVLPTRERLEVRAPGEVSDFVEDRSNFVGTTDRIIRKYEDRVLVIATERCAGHCMYCFRQDLLFDSDPDKVIPDVARDLNDLLTADPRVREVIFSGGDPMTLSVSRLQILLDAVAAAERSIDVRVHTKNFVFAPQTVSVEKLTALNAVNARLVLHVTHPYEITPDFEQAVERARALGLRLYAQFPLLRGVNDHVDVLRALLERLDNLGVRPLTIFIADPISYSAAFRIPLRRVREIASELHQSSPAWVNSVRFVLDTPEGKIRLADIPDVGPESETVEVERNGRAFTYTDFPDSLDIEGVRDVLLWREIRP